MSVQQKCVMVARRNISRIIVSGEEVFSVEFSLNSIILLSELIVSTAASPKVSIILLNSKTANSRFSPDNKKKYSRGELI
jgi:hypothetical protein